MELNFWSVLVGWVTATIGVVAAHRLNVSKERDARLAAFRGFLGRWKGRTGYETDLAKLYADWLEHLWGYYCQCYRDFSCADKIRVLCEDLSSLNPEDIKQDAGKFRPLIISKIDALHKAI